MGRNDVEIQIKAKDAVGPGIDSARAKLGTLASSMGGSLTDGAIKFAGAVNGIKGAVDLATAGIQLLRGNTDGVGDALQRLPLGIGAIIGSIRELNKVLGETNSERRQIEEARIGGISSRRFQTLEGLGRFGESKIDSTERAAILAAENERVELINAAFKAAKGRSDNDTFQREKAEIERLFQLRVNVAKNEAAFDREFAASQERIAKANRERAERDLQIDSTRMRLIQEQNEIDASRGVTPRNRFGFGADPSDLLAADIEGVRRMFGGGAGGLASGDSSRFTTGGAASAQERAATEAAKSAKTLEDILAELKKANEPAKEGNQINLTQGIFGGAA